MPQKRITPYWRILKTDGEARPNYPGGAEAQSRLLKKEADNIIKKDKKHIVADFEKYLIRL